MTLKNLHQRSSGSETLFMSVICFVVFEISRPLWFRVAFVQIFSHLSFNYLGHSCSVTVSRVRCPRPDNYPCKIEMKMKMANIPVGLLLDAIGISLSLS